MTNISKITNNHLRGQEVDQFKKLLAFSIKNPKELTKSALYSLFNGLSYEIQGDAVLLVGDFGTHYYSRIEDI